MRKVIFLSLFVFCCSASANIGVEVNLSQNLDLGWSKVTKYRHSLDCYPKGKPTGYNDLGSEAISTQTTKNVSGAGASWPIKSNHYPFTLGSTSVALVQMESTSPYVKKYRVTLSDDVKWDSYLHWGDSDCVAREYHWHVRSHNIHGYYAITYQLPQNRHAIRIKIVESSGQGAQFAQKTVGDYHGQPIEIGQDMFIWADPGSVIKIPVDVNISSGKGVQGSFQIEFEELGASSSDMGFQSLFESLNGIHKDYLSDDLKDDTIKRFLEVGSAVLAESEISKSIVNNIGLEKYRGLVDWLYELANREFPDLKYELHLKAMAAALGYEFALNLLEDLRVFCDDKEVYLPYSDRTIRTKGFLVAHYWLNRDIRRLQAIRFPEIRAFLQELVRWENNKFTYSQIASNQSEFQKLREGYIKLRQHSELAFDVYGDIRRGIDKTFATFQNVGVSDEIRDRIQQELDALSKERHTLNANFTEVVLAFKKSNTSSIQASNLLAALNELEGRTFDLSRDLLSRVKLVDLNSDPKSGFLASMTSLLGHQVAIFDEELRSSFVEPIRRSYQNKERTSAAKRAYAQCLEVQ